MLQVKDNSVKRGNKARIDRFLCGHDERDWFVAAVPGSATTVKQAMENLMPPQVRAAALKSGLKLDDKFTRRNKAFLRQGEWFFIPHPDKQVQNKDILKNEPIRRGRGKPHMVQELYRNGGETVFVCARHPNGLTPVQQSELFNRNPSARLWLWRSMVRGASVYARGRVSHSDHATIVLPCWHEVVMNTESNSRTMANVAFLD